MNDITLLLWRHGQTDANLSGRIQGWGDNELNETGQRQAALAAADIAHRFRVSSVVSSDLRRARATADALAGLVGVEVAPEPRLRERGYGRLENLRIEDLDRDLPGVWPATQRGEDVSEHGVEPLRDLADRGASAIEEHAEQAAAGTAVVVVAHGTLLRAATIRLLGLAVGGFQGIGELENARYSVLVTTGDPEAPWSLVEHGAPGDLVT